MIKKKRKTKLLVSLSVIIIVFLISASSLNIVNTQAQLDTNDNQYFIESFDRTYWKWTTTNVISTESTSVSEYPSLVVDAVGNVHIAWGDITNYAGSGTGYDIFYKRWEVSTSTWTTTEVVSTESTSFAWHPSITVDATGNVHIAWQDLTNYAGSETDSDVFYKRWEVSTSTWTTTEVVSTESTGHSYELSIVTDVEGNVYLAWEDDTDYGSGTDVDIFYKYWEASTSTWSTTEVVSTESTSGSNDPSITVDAAGNVHVSWRDYTNYDSAGTDYDIFYKCWDDSTSSWNTTEVVSTESTAGSYDPSIATDAVGDVQIAWADSTDYAGAGTDYDIFYKRRDASASSWTTTEVVSTDSATQGGSSNPSLAVDTEGSVHVAWESKDLGGSMADQQISYKMRESSSHTWTTTEEVSTESAAFSDSPSLGVDSAGRVHVSWYDETNFASCGTDRDVFYKLLAGTPTTPELAIIIPNPTELPNIYLDWNNVLEANIYHVYRSTSYIWSVNNLFPITSVSSSEYIDTLASEGIYYYVIVAENLAGNGSHSNCQYVEVSFPVLEAPELSPILPNPTNVSSISLTWDSIDDATGYHVYRSNSYIWSVEGLTSIATVASTSYVDSLPSEGTYFYVVVASDGVRNSTHSNCEYVEVSFPDIEDPFIESPELSPILPNPTNVSSISLIWDDVDGATEYYIYRSVSYIWSVEGLTSIATVISTSYFDSLLSEGTYFYVVVASDGVITSTHSNCEYVEVKFPVIEDPFIENPELSPLLPSPTDISSVSLIWDDVDGATEYYIYSSVSYIWSVEGLTSIATVISTSYVDSLPSEGTYFYVVVASDGVMNSTHSNCEYIVYKLPTLHEYIIISSLIIGIPIFLFAITRIRKKKT